MNIANVALDGSKDYGPKLCAWLRSRRPDIVTLQKIGSHFPTIEELRDIDYESKCIDSPDPYLGVAVLTHRKLWKKPQVCVRDLPSAEDDSRFLTARFLTVTIGDLWVTSVYAPYGPKRWGKRAIARRVAWLNRLRKHVRHKGYAQRKSLLCGDFNVKVKSDGPPKGNLYSEEEQAALEELLRCGFVDVYRDVHRDPRKKGCTRGYSKTYPEGESRLHLILASKRMMRHQRSARVDDDSGPCWPRDDAPPLLVKFDDFSLQEGV